MSVNVISDTSDSCVDLWLSNGTVMQYILMDHETNIERHRGRIEQLAKVLDLLLIRNLV